MMTGGEASGGWSGPGGLSVRPVRVARLMAAGVVIGVAAVGGADAQPKPRPTKAELVPPQPGVVLPEAAVAKLIAALDSDDLDTRRAATEQLGRPDGVSLETIEKALDPARQPPLSPEQRQRLLVAGQARFGQAPRAAMGVEFNQTGPLRDRVVVERTIQEFPCSKLLEDGDIIDIACGQKLTGPAGRVLLRALIISHSPGDVMEVEVLRGAERVALKVPLGRYQDLRNTAGLDPETLKRSWRARLQRVGVFGGAGAGGGAAGGAKGGESEPIRTGLTEEQWRDPRLVGMNNARPITAPPVRSIVATGAKPRLLGGEDGPMARIVGMGGWVGRDRDELALEFVRGQLMLAGGGLGDGMENLPARSMTTEEEIAQLQQQVEALKAAIAKRAAFEGVVPAPQPNVRGGLPDDRQLRLAEKQLAAVKADAAAHEP